MEIIGFEPMTPCLQGRCSSQLSYTPVAFESAIFFFTPSKLYSVTSQVQSLSLSLTLCSSSTALFVFRESCFSLFVIPRKEVIQPHLPIRLPCYDFTPVIDLTFDCSLLTVRIQASGSPNSHGVTGGVYKTRERIHRDILIRDY